MVTTRKRKQGSPNKPPGPKKDAHSKKKPVPKKRAPKTKKELKVPEPLPVEVSDIVNEVMQDALALPLMLSRIVVDAVAAFPPRFIKYLRGVAKAVQTADYYYRDYFEGGTPPTEVVKEEDRLKLLVISESHARTNPEIVGVDILSQYDNLVPKKYQKGHLNLVHCLSYGEAWLAGITDKNAAAGTLIFWKVFMILAGMIDDKITSENKKSLFAALLKENTTKEKRVATKVEILDRMEERKIQLIDMTPVHLYLASGTVHRESKEGNIYYSARDPISAGEKSNFINYSWENYTKQILLQKRPRKVLILGKTIEDSIGEKAIHDFINSIGAECLGYRKHPSDPKSGCDLNDIREFANASQKSQLRPDKNCS
jgi:hypothetical protein